MIPATNLCIMISVSCCTELNKHPMSLFWRTRPSPSFLKQRAGLLQGQDMILINSQNRISKY